MRKILKQCSIVLVAIFLVSCAKDINTPQLNKAKSEFMQINKDPRIKHNASLELLQADKIYQKSKSVTSELEADHIAYLLLKEVQIAKEVAFQKELEEKVEDLKEQKTKAMIDSKMIELKAMQNEVDETKNQLLVAQKEAEAAQKETEAQKLKMQQKLQQLKELHAKETNRGLVLTLGDVLFESSYANLMPGAGRTIDKLAEFLASYPNRNVLIEGHTDNVGSDKFNLNLSHQRAVSVAKALQEKGILEGRILTQGLGEVYPVAPNKTEAGKQKNRRVEIIVLKENVSHESMKR